MKAINDNLIVERMRDTKETIDINLSRKDLTQLQYGDEVIVESFEDFGRTPSS